MKWEHVCVDTFLVSSCVEITLIFLFVFSASRVEITLFGSYKYLVTHLDTERKMITTPWGEELHLDELNHFLPINIVLQRHKYAQRLFHLNLSTQELSVLQAIVATAPGT